METVRNTSGRAEVCLNDLGHTIMKVTPVSVRSSDRRLWHFLMLSSNSNRTGSVALRTGGKAGFMAKIVFLTTG